MRQVVFSMFATESYDRITADSDVVSIYVLDELKRIVVALSEDSTQDWLNRWRGFHELPEVRGVLIPTPTGTNYDVMVWWHEVVDEHGTPRIRIADISDRYIR